MNILYNSDDLFQSTSVLAYICNPQMPSNPADFNQPNCNSLQSPILQFVIYLYCRVHLALLHHLRRVGLFRKAPHRAPQAG